MLDHNDIKEITETINNVLKNIEKSGKISKAGIESLQGVSNKLSSNERNVGGFIAQDVRENAQQRDIELTDEQVEAILDQMEHKMDATIGINWDIIDIHTDDVLEEWDN